MKKILTIFVITLFCIKVYSQQSSRNGIFWPTKDTIRCLVVFVSYYNAPDSTKIIPANANTYFNATMPTDKDQLVGITKYFHEASFGKLVVLGDYVNKVIVVNSSAINNNYNDHLSVFPALHLALANDSTTKNGYSINRHFYNWSYFENGIPKVKTPNKFIDVLVMIHIPSTRYNGTGYTKQTPIISEILDMDGVSIYTSSSRGLDVLRHELAHSLLGGNSYHSGGGNSGERWTLSPMGGYSLLSGSNRNFNSVNGWDRWRLGWFSDSAKSKNLEIYALNEQQKLISSDIDSSMGTKIFMLRDFTKYGDAIRIKLPYIGSQSDGLYPEDQWLWIENHQVMPNTMEALNYNGVRPAGIRINYQIGKNDLNFNEPVRNHLITPMIPFGNFDFTYTPAIDSSNADYSKKLTIITNTNLANPFTGYNFSHVHAYNTIFDNKILGGEYIIPSNMIFDDKMYDCSNMFHCNPFYPNTLTGSNRDVFLKNDIISISTNPSTTPLITHKAKSQVDFIYELPEEYDNRYIYLNGLKIEILDAYYNTDGNGKDYKIKISWRNYTVQNNVRWTGNIILHEQVIIQSGNTVTLDQGLSATKSSNPQTINGTYVFADKTVFICKPNSTITIEDGAKLILRNGSSLILENGAKVIIKGSGQLVLECGTTLESKMYSYIELHDFVSSIIEEIGSSATYWSIPGSGSIVGNGKRIQFSGNTIVSNISYTTKSLEFGAIITTQGSVKIQSPQVIFTAKEVYLNSGFEVYPGSSLILDTNNFNCQ